jgi:hypothetical protein
MTVSVGQTGIFSGDTGFDVTSISTAATSSPTTTGSGFIVVFASVSGGITTSACTDTFGNNYQHLAAITDSTSVVGSEANFERWYCANGTGGASHQATLTISGESYAIAAFIEVKGAALTNAGLYGASAHNFYGYLTSSPYTTSLSVTPPSSGAMLISCFVGASTTGGASSPTLSESSGFTILGQANGQGGGYVPSIGYRVVSGSATYTPSWTMASPVAVSGDVTIDSFFGTSGSLGIPVAWWS